MRKIVIISLLILCIKCQINHCHLLSDKEWEDILWVTVALSSLDDDLIYSEYENREMKDILAYTYINSAEILDYEVNDSILNYIKNRPNCEITNRLEKISSHITVISDTSKIYNDYLIYSEPFIFKNILCISMKYRNVKSSFTNIWVCFFEKQDSKYKLIEFYNYNKDQFFVPEQTQDIGIE